MQKQNGNKFYLRPPFQFIDDQLENVEESHTLQYRVEAHATDRVLATTLINVTRKTEKPLPPVGQTLALHTPNPDDPQGNGPITFIVPAWEPEADPNELVICYRSVPAARFGAYGYDLRPALPMRWVDGLPARRNNEKSPQIKNEKFPQIKFAESSESRPLPWEETKEVPGTWGTWVDEKISYINAETGQEATTAFFQYEQHEIARWPKPGFGRAIEFYIGRFKKQDKQDKPLERSALIKCRHAVAATAPKGWLRADGTLDLSRGNTVDAFEPLGQSERAFVAPAQMRWGVEYPPPPADETSEPSAPEIILTWRHDHSEDSKGVFNPVVGYRIHCLDRYNPAEYPLSEEDCLEEGCLPGRPLVTVRAIPERLYRATPESIVVEGLPTIADSETRSSWLKEEYLGEPQTIDEELHVRQLEDKSASEFTPNWIAASQEPLKKWNGGVNEQTEFASPQDPLLWEAGPIFLQKSLIDTLKELTGSLNAKCRLILHHPLEKRAFVEKVDLTTKDALIDRLTTQLDGRNDPYGWWLAEALGLSCECVLLARDDVPIPAEAIRDYFLQQTALSCSVAFFRADDGRTLLNVFRVIATRPSDDVIRISLLSRLTGKAQPSAWPEEAIYKSISDRLDGLSPNATLQEYIHVIRVTDQGAANGVPVDPSPAEIELPVTADGTLTFRWRAPDPWGHQYAVAIEKVRRYDALRDRLKADEQGTSDEINGATDETRLADEQDTSDEINGTTDETRLIAKEHLKEIEVARTRPLVAHNLIVTPLPGSIQALVFRHPAAFAATASAVNASHSQYAGQTVILQRRIDQREKVIEQYTLASSSIDWGTYQPHKADDDAAPPQVPSIWAEDKELALQPVPGTESGVYGADRYVYPDLPGYYQYRVAVYSAAGRAGSPIEVSDWVQPLYDQGVQSRQQPKVITPDSVSFADSKLTIELPVVHAAHHLRPELRSLWRDADEKLPDDVGGHRFGDLPDLYLTYQIYLRTNSLQEPTGVYIPLCRLIRPMPTKESAQENNTVGLGFRMEDQTIGKPEESVVTCSLQQVGVNTDSFSLAWKVVANLGNALDPSLSAALQQAENNHADYILVAVERHGVWSDFVTGSGEPLQEQAPNRRVP